MFKKKYTILYLCLLVVFSLAGVKYFQISSAIKESEGKGPPPQTINTELVVKRSWPVTVSAVGEIKAVKGSILSFEDSGRVAKINITSGQEVKKNDILVELDSKVESANLTSAVASLKLAKLTVERQRELRKKNANSKTDLDKAEADYSLAEAEVARNKSVIKRRQIVAPFDGTAGVNKVNVGEYVNIGTQAFDVNSYDEFKLDFYLPQKKVVEFKLGDKVVIKLDEEHTADLSAINSQVDPVNRNVLLQATLKNPSANLKPGMFVDLDLVRSEANPILVIPTTSIKYAPYGDTVYEVKKDSAAKPPYDYKPITVKLGRTKGDFTQVISGLKEGQEIIASGTSKLIPGGKIFINNDVKAPLSENPKVENK